MHSWDKLFFFSFSEELDKPYAGPYLKIKIKSTCLLHMLKKEKICEHSKIWS